MDGSRNKRVLTMAGESLAGGWAVDRRTWLAERRAAGVACYDSEATTYDANECPAGEQRQWVARLLRGCPPDGRWWPA
jgi:hypothetical protein